MELYVMVEMFILLFPEWLPFTTRGSWAPKNVAGPSWVEMHADLEDIGNPRM